MTIPAMNRVPTTAPMAMPAFVAVASREAGSRSAGDVLMEVSVGDVLMYADVGDDVLEKLEGGDEGDVAGKIFDELLAIFVIW